MSSYAEAMARQRNANMARDDIEWIVLPSGEMKLQFKPSWSARHTKELERKAEADRRQHMHRQRYPITGGGN